MLSLNRKKDETIMIAGNIAVTVLDIKGNSVQLGIRAPRAVPIDRLEVFMKKGEKPHGPLDDEVEALSHEITADCGVCSSLSSKIEKAIKDALTSGRIR